MKKNKIVLPLLGSILGILVVVASCSKNGDNGPDVTGKGTDSVLLDLGTHVIVPSYQQLATTTATLDAAVTAFNTSPTGTTLTAVQNALKDAWKAWEAVSEFEFGPANDQSLTTHFVNSFPTDTAIIKNNINGTTYVIDGIANFAAQGFPALDYLLFAYGNTAVLARFTTAGNAAGAKQYLAALSASLKTKSAAVSSAWSSAYLQTFAKLTGTDAGSGLSQLVNAYVRDFDITLQNYKIGIPIGKYGPNTLPLSPTKVEGYFSGLSVQLLVAQVQALKNIYAGATLGLDDKVAATKVLYNGGSLNDAILNQLNTLLVKIQALPDPLPDGIQNNSPAITAAYTEIRKLTVMLKVDMCSALGIKISFQDDDGD